MSNTSDFDAARVVDADDEPTFTVEQSSSEGDQVTLAVTGEVDTYTSAKLRDALNAAIDGGATHVVVDVAGMNFIDSTGLGVLVGALKKLQERDGSLTLRSPSPATLQVLGIVGLTSHFGIDG